MNQTKYSDKVPLLIHAGFPKTASTWLQTNVFSNKSLGFSSPWGIRCGLAIDEFAVANPFDFNREDAIAAFAQHFPDTNEDVCVISEETLLGDPAKGRYWGKIVADRLYETFPQAKVFICIREQRSYILSAYKEYVRNGGVYSLERYLGVNVDRVGFGGIFQKSFLEYDKVVSYYQKLFGMENVLVLPFEMIESNPNLFIENLLGFTTKKTGNVNFEKVRSSLKSCTIEIRRRLNNYF
ncbi:MAG: hypothetical protein IPN42_11150 [Methylococcaceae bacterium]|nr:hypothetical protein [Methylococcaceae bacterium]